MPIQIRAAPAETAGAALSVSLRNLCDMLIAIRLVEKSAIYAFAKKCYYTCAQNNRET